MLPPRVLVLGKLHQSQMRSRDSTKSNYGIVSQHDEEMSDFCRMMMMVIIIIVVMIDYDGDSGGFGGDDDDDDEN